MRRRLEMGRLHNNKLSRKCVLGMPTCKNNILTFEQNRFQCTLQYKVALKHGKLKP